MTWLCVENNRATTKKDPQAEKHRTLVKNKKDPKKWRKILYLWIGRLHIVNSDYPKFISVESNQFY
jgi:hypothetical protein